MDKKIAEIICPDTRRESCDSCQRHYSIGECAKAKQIEAILALIEQEQAPMVEALKEAQLIAEECAGMNKRGVYPELISEELTMKLAELKPQIDTALREAQQ